MAQQLDSRESATSPTAKPLAVMTEKVQVFSHMQQDFRLKKYHTASIGLRKSRLSAYTVIPLDELFIFNAT